MPGTFEALAAIIDGLPGAPTSRTMTYDNLEWLKKVVSPLYGAVGANYTYDALDNLKHITIISGGVYTTTSIATTPPGT